MVDFTLPPAGFGPGSQQSPDGSDLEYMPMPQDMRTFSAHFPDIDGLDRASLTPALALLSDISAACSRVAAKGAPEIIELGGYDADNRALIAETLGEGEVAVRMRGIPAVAAQESVFAGVWVLSGVGIDQLEIAPFPTLARERAHLAEREAKGTRAESGPGVVNAPPLLAELLDKSAAYKSGDEIHVINLSLLPHTEEDLAYLDAALGEGAVTILSRGYGNCRVTATALPHVWRVQFFNSMDTLILDTIEVTDMPEVVIAADEDLVDSAERLLEVREAIE